jgi:hypothetical protein
LEHGEVRRLAPLRRLARVPASSRPTRRLYPATSAARMAACRRSTRSPLSGSSREGYPFLTANRHARRGICSGLPASFA